MKKCEHATSEAHVSEANRFEGNDLRSRPVSSPLSRAFAFFSNVSAGGVGAGPTAPASQVVLLVMLALGVLHVLVLVVGPVVGVSDSGELARDVDFLSLQKAVDNVTNLAVAWAEPGWIAISALRRRLHPEKVAVRGRGELEGKYAAVGLGSGLRGGLVFVGDKAAVGRDHHEIKLGIGEGGISPPPAEVYQIYWLSAHNPRRARHSKQTIFGVEIDVAAVFFGSDLPRPRRGL